MKTMCMRLGVLALLAVAGCVSDTANPEIMPGMIEDVVRSSIRDAHASPTFRRYVEGFRASHGGRIPVVKVGRIRSDAPAADPEILKERLVRPFLANLAAAGLVEISETEGSLSRNPKNDEPSETCARRREIPRAADIVLSVDVKFRETRQERGIVKEHKFELFVDAVRDGRRIWKYSAAKGYIVN